MEGQIKRSRGEDMGLVADWRLESIRRASTTGKGYLVTMTIAGEEGREESVAIKQDAAGKGYIHQIDGSGKESRNEKTGKEDEVYVIRHGKEEWVTNVREIATEYRKKQTEER